MREILFRGKRIDNGEWIEGSLINDGRCFIAIHPSLAFGPTSKDEINGETLWGFYPFFEVDPSTVGQYTGVNDKTGKKIFEGDIVKNYFSKRFDPIVGHVAFDDRYCRLRLYSCTGGSESGFYRGCVYEVIGNIYDNPELLKGE